MKPHFKGGQTNKTTSDMNSLHRTIFLHVGKETFQNSNRTSQLIWLIGHY